MPIWETVLLTGLIVAASALLTGGSVLLCKKLGLLMRDRMAEVQRVHKHWAPRIGGLPIFGTIIVALLLVPGLPERDAAIVLMVCALPAFVAGTAEDFWNRVGPRIRLFATFVSAWLAWFLLDGQLLRVDIPGFDLILGSFAVAAFFFTAFAVGGVAHSINIIDGFNGLASFYSVICFAAMYVVGGIVGDELIQTVSLLFCASLLGFLVWNYPFGRVFLGDGGAYLIGFALGELAVLLVARNPEVSPWFCFLLMAYPIWDTLFSSYRREVKRRTSWSAADALHMHHLIYRRLVRPLNRGGGLGQVTNNAMTAPYVWVMGLMCAVPALAFWHSTPTLVGFTLLFAVTYGLLYWSLVRFRAPRALVMPGGNSPAGDPSETKGRL